jgi:pSer/pThr/pTyr-binding forkhead associated (FHA) protein
MSHIYCPECGFQNPEAANYCAECGIFLDDVTVSRKHAELVQREGRWLVEDQGSLNGTFVNRKRVESAELDDGDELQIGKYRLTFLKR